jgi:serine phosphatase RsbU (regulator of sigma subunit)
MKHISSKIILLTILLVASLITLNGFLSVRILRNESKAYSFQNQQLQTQTMASRFELEFSKAQEYASLLGSQPIEAGKLDAYLSASLKNQKKSTPTLHGVGIYLKSGAAGTWHEDSAGSIANALHQDTQFIQDLQTPTIVGKADANGDYLILFPSPNAVIGVRMSFEKVKDDCAGTPVGIFNRSGEAILFCDDAAEAKMADAHEAVQTAIASTFKSGSFEKAGAHFDGLWAYSDLSNWGKVISVNDTSVAYRPAYEFAVQIGLLVLVSLGLAIIASILVARKVSAPIMLVAEATQKIANGEFDTSLEVNTRDETRTLSDSVKSMAQKIKRLIGLEIEKAKLDAQLEVAGEVQRMFIPESHVRIDNCLVNSFYKPADQCGGDWWSFIRGKKRIAFLIGDVTGHGYASAMLVAVTRGSLAIIQSDIDKAGELQMNPNELLKTLNHVVYGSTKAEMNMTALCLILDLETGEYACSSAGHNAAYILDSETGKIQALQSRGVRLGETSQFSDELEVLEGKLTQTQRLVLFTDGIQELGTGDKLLERKGFRNFLQKEVGSDGKRLVSAVANDLIPLNQGQTLIDDVTFLVIELTGAREAQSRT